MLFHQIQLIACAVIARRIELILRPQSALPSSPRQPDPFPPEYTLEISDEDPRRRCL
jgi:hypothetical protein